MDRPFSFYQIPGKSIEKLFSFHENSLFFINHFIFPIHFSLKFIEQSMIFIDRPIKFTGWSIKFKERLINSYDQIIVFDEPVY